VDTLNAQNYGGYSDWRLPSIKELYSLIDFSGVTGMTVETAIPYIDADYFAFGYGDEAAGQRIIDAQYWSSTEYVSTTMGGMHTVFGVNFADGRIKGYGTSNPMGGEMSQYVRYVRGNTDYGVNAFVAGDDSTVTDNATGLMWAQDDSGMGMDWEAALAWVQQMNDQNYLGYNDWRLPDAKELQSIVDYSRSPDTTGSAAIDPVFNISTITDDGGETDYPFFWTSTTHLDGPPQLLGNYAVYVAFGEAEGWMWTPFGGYQLQDVHGAGAQRSDPKSGDPGDYPYGHGPQGDVIRIYNYVRLVRDADDSGDDNVAPTAEAAGPYSGEVGDTITLDGSGSTDSDGTIAAYAWDLDNDGRYDDASGATADFVVSSAGTLTVGLRVTDDDGAINVDTATITVAELPNIAPAADAGGPYSGAEGDLITLSGTASSDADGTIAAYAWDLDNDGQYDDATGAIAAFNATTAGTFTVGLRVTDDDGAQDTATATVTVEAPPNVAPTAEAGGPYESVVGNVIMLDGSASTDADGTIVLYQWDLDNDGQYDDATGATAAFNAATVGTSTIGLRVTDDDGAQDSDAAVLDIVDEGEANQPPNLVHPIQDHTISANRKFRLRLRPDTFVDPDAEQTLSYSATQADGSPLPRWLRFNSRTRTFSGRPLVRDVGQYDIRVTATDSGSPSQAAWADFSIDVTPHRCAWQNADLSQDVDGNELVTPLDALVLIRQLMVNGASSLPESGPTSTDASPSFLDVSGDNLASPLDVLMVINFLCANRSTSGEGESAQQPFSGSATESPLLLTPPENTFLASESEVDFSMPLLEQDEGAVDDGESTPVQAVIRDLGQDMLASDGDRRMEADCLDLRGRTDATFTELDALLPDIAEDIAAARPRR